MSTKKQKPPPKPLSYWLRLVEPIPGEKRRFHAPSRNSPGYYYLVDLEAKDFNGQCACENHYYRGVRCWHIKLCMVYWYNKTIREQAAADNPGSKEYHGA